MSKTFNKNIQYTFNPQITLPSSSSLNVTGTLHTIGSIIISGGNVGIGTTAPTSRLTISSNAAHIAMYPTTNGSEASMAFFNNSITSGNTTRWVIGNNAASGIGNFGFWNSSYNAPIIALTSTGNVGIGTTSPQSNLSVYSSSTAGIYNITSNNSSYSFIYAVRRRNNNADMVTADLMGEIGFAGSHNGFQNTPMTTLRGIYAGSGINRSAHLTFLTENVDSGLQERMRLTNSGSLGIGTTSPSYTLDINGTLEASNSNGLMLFASSGNVGIGTTSPGSTLDVKAGSWGGVRIFPGVNGGESAIGFLSNADNSTGTGATTSNWLIGINLVSYPIGQFNIRSNALGTASIFTIATNGNIGIGTTGPSTKLHVNGDLTISNRSTSVMIQPGLTQSTSSTSYTQYEMAGTGNHYFWDNLQASGTITGATKNFCIKHPINSTKALVHAAIEAPRYDLIYSGKVNLVSGQAIVNIDIDSCPEHPMENGTFEALTRNPRIFLQNNVSFDRVKASLNGNLLTIICENINSTDTIDWMIIAERKDNELHASKFSDDNNYLITEHILEDVLLNDSYRPSNNL